MTEQSIGSATGDGALIRRLQAAQKKVISAPLERRTAVLDARAAGWSERRIARVLTVDPTTVRAILAAAQKPTKGAPE